MEVSHAFRRVSFSGTFGQIWHHKRLWLFGLLGLTLASSGLLVYQFPVPLAERVAHDNGRPGIEAPG